MVSLCPLDPRDLVGDVALLIALGVVTVIPGKVNLIVRKSMMPPDLMTAGLVIENESGSP